MCDQSTYPAPKTLGVLGRTTMADYSLPCPRDRVDPQFKVERPRYYALLAIEEALINLPHPALWT